MFRFETRGQTWSLMFEPQAFGGGLARCRQPFSVRLMCYFGHFPPSDLHVVCDGDLSTRPVVAGAAHSGQCLVLEPRKAAGIAQTRVACVSRASFL